MVAIEFAAFMVIAACGKYLNHGEIGQVILAYIGFTVAVLTGKQIVKKLSN